MFSFINIIIGVGIFFILVLLVVLFLTPTDKKKEKKKKKVEEGNPEQEKIFQETIARLEKHVESLRHQIQNLEKNDKLKDKQLAIETAKANKFQEKLSQERDWHNKEQEGLDKKTNEIDKLSEDLGKLQENFSKEHATLLRYEREMKELKEKNDVMNDQRRSAESESAQLKAKVENCLKEIRELKKENAELSKKKEDAQWIAKSEYDQVVKRLKEREKELEVIKREVK